MDFTALGYILVAYRPIRFLFLLIKDEDTPSLRNVVNRLLCVQIWTTPEKVTKT